MADEITTETVAPITEAPVVQPSVEAPSAEPVVVPEVAPVVEEDKPDTLLGGDKTPEEVPAEEPKPAEESPAEVKEEAPVEELPTYEPFTLPEGFTADEEKMGEYTKTLAEFENTTKASHEEVQKLGQQFLEKHVAEMQRYNEALTHAWEKQKTDWKDSFLKDPEFTNRTNTVLNSAIDAINVYAGDVKQQDEFRGLMESTGVGNHPAMIRLLSNVMLAKAEPKPLAAPQIASPQRQSKISKMYGNKGN